MTSRPRPRPPRWPSPHSTARCPERNAPPKTNVADCCLNNGPQSQPPFRPRAPPPITGAGDGKAEAQGKSGQSTSSGVFFLSAGNRNSFLDPGLEVSPRTTDHGHGRGKEAHGCLIPTFRATCGWVTLFHRSLSTFNSTRLQSLIWPSAILLGLNSQFFHQGPMLRWLDRAGGP